jgi:perosamine synthetase
MKMERIPVSGPWITQKEADYVADAVKNAWYGNANAYNERFEAEFARYVGRRFAIALTSCTSAIHLSLLALGIGPGDEVIVPDITWIATAAPVSYVGASPAFADVDRETWCLSAEALERRVTPATKAVIPVDLYGNMPDMDRIREAAARHGLAVIEDAAEAIGSEYGCHKAGSFGDTSVFSFHGSKTMTTGEGGMLVTDREDIYRRCLFLRDHGRSPGGPMFWNTEIAFKYKMSAMQAALGLAQLSRIDELLEKKRRILEWYRSGLDGVEGISMNPEPPGIKNSYWMVTVIPDEAFGPDKERLIALMSERSIDCRPFFYPLSSLPAYERSKQAGEAKRDNVNAYALSRSGINLPSGLSLTGSTVDYVCKSLKAVLCICRERTPVLAR